MNTGEPPVDRRTACSQRRLADRRQADLRARRIIFIAGAAVQWLRDGLGIIAGVAETAALARSVTTSQGVYFVPAFVGLGAPTGTRTPAARCSD